jgi:hypothetical protein
MRRTEARQGVRMISFRSVLDRHEAGELSQIEGGELLGISERTFRRWCRRYGEDGEVGPRDRRLGRPAPKRVPADDLAISTAARLLAEASRSVSVSQRSPQIILIGAPQRRRVWSGAVAQNSLLICALS